MNPTDKCFSKLKWTPQVFILITQQQSLLRSFRQTKSVQSWKKIATLMNQAFPYKNRSGKQCRQRYMNYVRFGQETPKISGWRPKQDELLFRKYMEVGAKWVQIGKQMPGRSENCLKNRFYGALRKIIRKLNKRIKQTKIKQKNNIKTDLLIKILQYNNNHTENQIKFQQNHQFIQQLKNSLVKMAIQPDEETNYQDIQNLLKNISKFGSMLKQSKTTKQNYQKIQKNQIKINENSSNYYHFNPYKQQQQINQTENYQNSPKTNQIKPKIIKNFILHSNPIQIANQKNIKTQNQIFHDINFGKQNKQDHL